MIPIKSLKKTWFTTNISLDGSEKKILKGINSYQSEIEKSNLRLFIKDSKQKSSEGWKETLSHLGKEDSLKTDNRDS